MMDQVVVHDTPDVVKEHDDESSGSSSVTTSSKSKFKVKRSKLVRASQRFAQQDLAAEFANIVEGEDDHDKQLPEEATTEEIIGSPPPTSPRRDQVNLATVVVVVGEENAAAKVSPELLPALNSYENQPPQLLNNNVIEDDEQEKERQKKLAEKALSLCLNSDEHIEFDIMWGLMNQLPADPVSMDTFGINEDTLKELESMENDHPLQTNMIMGFAGCGLSLYRLAYVLWHIVSTHKSYQSTVSQVHCDIETLTDAVLDKSQTAQTDLQLAHEDFKRLEETFRMTIKDMYEKQLLEKDKQIQLLQESMDSLKENLKLRRKENKELKVKVAGLEKSLQGHLTATCSTATSNERHHQQLRSVGRMTVNHNNNSTEENSEAKKRERLANISSMVRVKTTAVDMKK